MKIEQELTPAKGWVYYRNWILIEGVELTKYPYVRIFKQRKKAWGLSNEQLLQFPTGSLGKELGYFLSQNDITLIPKLEDHDVMHVLLELETTVEDEAVMQFILLGNGKHTLFCIGTAALCWVLLPEFRKRLKNAYRRGKKMRKFHHWKFQFLLKEPLSLIRAMIDKDLGELEAPYLW